jgi:hypothetical protein
LITARDPEPKQEPKLEHDTNLATLSENPPALSKMFGDNPDYNFADLKARDLFAI